MPENAEGAATTAPTEADSKSVQDNAARGKHPLAGRVVRLPNGDLFAVEDWWARVNPGDQDPMTTRNPGHLAYIVRRLRAGAAPVPGVYGHDESGLGHILAPDELEGLEVVR